MRSEPLQVSLDSHVPPPEEESPTNSHVHMNPDATLHDGNFKPLFRKCVKQLPTDPNACNYVKFWDISRVTDCGTLFWEPTGASQYQDWLLIPGADLFNVDVSGWDTSQCTTMRSMFNAASRFNQPIGTWDVRKVESMARMFESAEGFDQDISRWQTKSLTDLSHAFRYATKFNNGAAEGPSRLDWNVGKVQTFQYTFHDAEAFQGKIGHWDVSAARDTEEASTDESSTAFGHMFQGAEKFNDDLSKWSIKGARSLRFMFEGAKSFDQDLSAWQVDQITDFTGIFQNSGLNQTLCWNVTGKSNEQEDNNMLDGAGIGAQLDPNGNSCRATKFRVQLTQQVQSNGRAILITLTVFLLGVVLTCVRFIRGRQKKRRIIFRSNTKVEEQEILFQDDDGNAIIIDENGLFDGSKQDTGERYCDNHNDNEDDGDDEDEGIISFGGDHAIPSVPNFVSAEEGDTELRSLEQHAVDATLVLLELPNQPTWKGVNGMT